MRTIDAVWVKFVAERLERQGLSATELVQSAEIKPYLLNQKSARIPFYQHAALLDLAAKATENGCFGLELAANEGDPRDNGLLVYTALSSKTLGEALKVVERYFHVLNEAIDVNVEFSPREVTIDYQLSDARLAAPRQAHRVWSRELRSNPPISHQLPAASRRGQVPSLAQPRDREVREVLRLSRSSRNTAQFADPLATPAYPADGDG